jgi:16S rRNA (adenine1518-N6/adenine1519-N6)-dimethyltransferase
MMTIPNLPAFNAAEVMRNNRLHPDKSLGQNFLQSDSALRKIVETAMIAATDTVLEIGPGLGSLTRYLAELAKQVFTVELDGKLIPILNSTLKEYKNVRVVQNDILKLIISDLIHEDDFLVVANVPYYITSAIIRHLLDSRPRPRRIVLTIQKEVAQRICSKPGELSLLALSVQVFGNPSIVADLPAEAFYPRPNVDSSVIKMEIFKEPVIPAGELDLFFRLAKAGFGQKRKTLRNSLSGGLSIPSSSAEQILKSAGIDPMRRAETLSISEWKELTAFAKDSGVIIQNTTKPVI